MEENPKFQQIEREEGDKTRLTSCNISNDDWLFCKKHGLKFATLLQERIAQIKAVENGAIVENVQLERAKKEKFIQMCEKFTRYLDEKGLIDDFYKQDG